MINEKRLLEEFLELVQIDSHSSKEGKIAKVLVKKLEELGLEVTQDDAGEKVGGETGNIIAHLKGDKAGDPILFSCHMDTVKPGEGIKPEIRDGVIYSDGTTILGSDDKAGIASVLEALKQVKEQKKSHRDIQVVFSIWEEGGLFGSKNLDFSKIKAEYGFVLDSAGSSGEIVTKGPTQDSLTVTINGRPAHAGLAPEEGISAIMVAAKAIENMKLLRVDEDTTANIGVVQGGEATNVVMPKLEIKAEARSSSEEKVEAQTNHMIEVFENTAKEMGATVDIEHERVYPPFNIPEDHEIVRKTKEAFKNIGIEGHTASTGGGSDTNIFNGKGVTSLNLGVGMKKPHTLEEHISIEDLNNTAKVTFQLMTIF